MTKELTSLTKLLDPSPPPTPPTRSPPDPQTELTPQAQVRAPFSLDQPAKSQAQEPLHSTPCHATPFPLGPDPQPSAALSLQSPSSPGKHLPGIFRQNFLPRI